jgi:acetyltransferase-like isoleucine patch superfamily enzyme
MLRIVDVDDKLMFLDGTNGKYVLVFEDDVVVGTNAAHDVVANAPARTERNVSDSTRIATGK